MLPDNLKVFTKENCFRKDSHNISFTKTMYIDKKDITYRTVIDGKDYIKISITKGHPQIDIIWNLNNGHQEEFTYFIDSDIYIFSFVDTKQNKVYTNSKSIGMRNSFYYEMPENLLGDLSDMLSDFKKLKDIKNYLYNKFDINKK